MIRTPHPLLRRETHGTGDADGDDAPDRLLPEIAMVGWARFAKAKPEGLGPHRHPGAWEICYLTHGAVEWWTEAHGAQMVRRGDLFVTRPGETHGGADTVMHPCALFWAIIEAPQAEAENEMRVLHNALSAIAAPRFAGSPHCRDLPAGLLAEHRAFYAEQASGDNTEDPLRPVAARALLHGLLVQVARGYQSFAHTDEEPGVTARPLSATTSGDNAAFSPRVRRALAWMEAQLHEPFCIEDAARAVGASPTRLHDTFLREVGATPADWRMQRRVDEAKARLAAPLHAAPPVSVTTIAHDLEFASAQHFATVFKRYTGRAPTKWRHAPPQPAAPTD